MPALQSIDLRYIYIFAFRKTTVNEMVFYERATTNLDHLVQKSLRGRTLSM